MSKKKNTNSINQLMSSETFIAYVLQFGVISASIIIILGAWELFKNNHLVSSNYQSILGRSFVFPHSLNQIYLSVMHHQAVGIISLGILVLIITPALRVLSSIIMFIFKKNWPMTYITLFVFCVLMGSFILGLYN